MPTSDAFSRAFGLHQQGRLREAFDAYNNILITTPAHAPALHYSGLVLHQSGRPDLALPRVQRSIAIDPASADAWSNIALIYQALGRHAEALDALSHATRRAPRDGAIWENYAAALLDASRCDEAEHAARTAVRHAPGSPGAWYNLALALQQQHRYADALHAARRAVALAPDAAALIGLEAALVEAQGAPDAARSALEAALRRADHPALRFQLASLCERTGDLRAAAAAYERLLDADPQGAALSQLLFLRKRLADWHDLDALRGQFRAAIGTKPMLSPFCLLSDPSSRAEQRRCAEAWSRGFEEGSTSGTVAAQGVGTRSSFVSGDRLTIGYLSADFHMHATALLTAGLFERHDRKRYHVIAYSTGRDDESPLRKRVEKAFDSFVDAKTWSVSQLADRIRADRVDILVDLKGHTEQARMDVLARRAAPIQVSYLGYPGTTGATFIDYVIGDGVVTPLEHASDYSETIVQLPGCYQVNDRERAVATLATRESLGLPAHGAILCSFNQAYKINPDVLDAWARILARVPHAVLWLLARSRDDPAIEHLRTEVERRGIDPRRMVFATRCPNPEYLALYGHAQLALDTWPYNGHTTTSDALWAGCPVVTVLGDTFAGRVAASILEAAGLPELVAPDVSHYVDLAATLAEDAARCARYRGQLLGAGRASRLFDVERTTRDIERAFEAMAAQREAGRREPIVLTPVSRA